MTAPQEQNRFGCSIDVAAGIDFQGKPAAIDWNMTIVQQLGELIGLTRELTMISREELRLVQRAEERFQKQQQAQRDEFQRWLSEHPNLSGRCGDAHEVIRSLLGQSISELVEFVDSHDESLLESDFLRADMVDRFGSLLNHVSAMHSVLKRLTAVDEAAGKPSDVSV